MEMPALETERLGSAPNEAEAQAILERLLVGSDNLAARIEYVRIAAKRGDTSDAARLGNEATSRAAEAQEYARADQRFARDLAEDFANARSSGS